MLLIIFFLKLSIGSLQLIYEFQIHCEPFVHISIPKNCPKKVKNSKNAEKIPKVEFQTCGPNSVLKVEPKQNQFSNSHSIRFKIDGAQIDTKIFWRFFLFLYQVVC